MTMKPHHIVDCTPGQRPRILAWNLTDDAEIRRVIGIYHRGWPCATVRAVPAADFDALARSAGFAE